MPRPLSLQAGVRDGELSESASGGRLMNAFRAPRVPDSPCEGMAGNRVLPVATSRKKFQSTVMMVGACVLIAAAVIQIVSTYRVFSTTADEPATVAAGMEWLDRGTYDLDNTH